MATLLIKSEGFEGRVLKLKLGANRLGRNPENDFQIEHPTVSATHCEIEVGDALIVRDCGSTNGTFVDGHLVVAARLLAGRELRLGHVELVAESTDAAIQIARSHAPPAARAAVLADGSLVCPRHSQTRSTYRCLRCREVMCDDCVRRIGRPGGKVYKLCARCGNHCEVISPEPQTCVG